MTQNNSSHRIYNFHELSTKEQRDSLNELAALRGLKVEPIRVAMSTTDYAEKENACLLFKDCVEMCSNISKSDSDFLISVYEFLQFTKCKESLASHLKPDKLQTLFNFEQEGGIIV